jgi:hypothetical protein
MSGPSFRAKIVELKQNLYLSAYEDLKLNSPVNMYLNTGMKASKGKEENYVHGA